MPNKLQINPDNIKAILKYLVLINVKEILSFQGLIKYYWWFIKDFSNITALIIDLLKENTSFQWKKKQEEAFKVIKDKFYKESILVYFNFKK